MAVPPVEAEGEDALGVPAVPGPAVAAGAGAARRAGRASVGWDGEQVGELEVRGPWITGSYYRDDDPEKFDDGWLRTGDVGSLDPGRVPAG